MFISCFEQIFGWVYVGLPSEEDHVRSFWKIWHDMRQGQMKTNGSLSNERNNDMTDPWMKVMDGQ